MTVAPGLPDAGDRLTVAAAGTAVGDGMVVAVGTGLGVNVGGLVGVLTGVGVLVTVGLLVEVGAGVEVAVAVEVGCDGSVTWNQSKSAAASGTLDGRSAPPMAKTPTCGDAYDAVTPTASDVAGSGTNVWLS